MAIPTVVQELILEAWEGVWPRLLKDPDELAARLARRRLGILARPWRPFCLAIRAADVRINPYWFVITPEHAMDLDDPRHPYEPIEHEVTLTSERVRMLTRPVKLLPPGEPAFEVAKKLGVEYSRMSPVMRRGVFHVTPKPGLRGRKGPPIPLLYVDRWLDPTAQSFEFPEALWGTQPDCGPLWGRIPDGIEQVVRRRPVYRMFRGERQFNGWHWVCPGCAEGTKMMYRPLPPPMLALEESLPGGIRKRIEECDGRERGLQCFACYRCHGIRAVPRERRVLWHTLVTLFTGGLLSGHEVDVPPGFDRKALRARKRAKSVGRKRPPARSEHGAEILRLAVETDWTLRRIAGEVGICRSGVGRQLKRILRDHGVETREELQAARAKRSGVSKVA